MKYIFLLLVFLFIPFSTFTIEFKESVQNCDGDILITLVNIERQINGEIEKLQILEEESLNQNGQQDNQQQDKKQEDKTEFYISLKVLLCEEPTVESQIATLQSINSIFFEQIYCHEPIKDICFAQHDKKKLAEIIKRNPEEFPHLWAEALDVAIMDSTKINDRIVELLSEKGFDATLTSKWIHIAKRKTKEESSTSESKKSNETQDESQLSGKQGQDAQSVDASKK